MSNDGEIERRLIIVANRHPVTIKKIEDGYTFNISAGGLVTGLSGLPPALKANSIYYGWPGINVPEDEVAEVEEGMENSGGLPIWVDEKLMDMHYNGFSSGSLCS